MNIIISPAKKMNVCNNDLSYKHYPTFMNKASALLENMQSFSYDELKQLLACNDAIANLNFERYKNMNLENNLTPAILAYEGIQYKYMSPNSFTNDNFEYVEKHLKILSGFYGILRPFDGVVPYRLEMQAKLKVNDHKNLYDFWGNSIYTELTKNDNTILNLASKEYSKVVEKYLTEDDRFITCIFGSFVNGKIKVKATEAKMARGLMTRFCAENNITYIDDVKDFSELGFKYSKEHSTPSEFVFLKSFS